MKRYKLTARDYARFIHGEKRKSRRIYWLAACAAVAITMTIIGAL